MDSTDWNAAISSEVFRNYASAELEKEAANKKTPEDELNMEVELLQNFEKFEAKVNSSPILKAAFKKMQDTFMRDPDYTAKVSSSFVEGVMMLQLEDNNDS